MGQLSFTNMLGRDTLCTGEPDHACDDLECTCLNETWCNMLETLAGRAVRVALSGYSQDGRCSFFVCDPTGCNLLNREYFPVFHAPVPAGTTCWIETEDDSEEYYCIEGDDFDRLYVDVGIRCLGTTPIIHIRLKNDTPTDTFPGTPGPITDHQLVGFEYFTPFINSQPLTGAFPAFPFCDTWPCNDPQRIEFTLQLVGGGGGGAFAASAAPTNADELPVRIV